MRQIMTSRNVIAKETKQRDGKEGELETEKLEEISKLE
jgi:hypothetical protein